MTNQKDDKDDVISTDPAGPESITDEALENVDGGITLDNGLKSRITSFGINADTIYAGTSSGDLIDGGLADTIYAGSEDLIGDFTKFKR